MLGRPAAQGRQRMRDVRVREGEKMTQRFWKFSAYKKSGSKLLELVINKSLDSKPGFAAIGWYIEAKKDLSEFSDNRNGFKRQLSKIINPVANAIPMLDVAGLQKEESKTTNVFANAAWKSATVGRTVNTMRTKRAAFRQWPGCSIIPQVII